MVVLAFADDVGEAPLEVREAGVVLADDVFELSVVAGVGQVDIFYAAQTHPVNHFIDYYWLLYYHLRTPSPASSACSLLPSRGSATSISSAWGPRGTVTDGSGCSIKLITFSVRLQLFFNNERQFWTFFGGIRLVGILRTLV